MWQQTNSVVTSSSSTIKLRNMHRFTIQRYVHWSFTDVRRVYYTRLKGGSRVGERWMAQRGEVWEGCPLPTGRVWGGAPPQNFCFEFLSRKWRIFVHSANDGGGPWPPGPLNPPLTRLYLVPTDQWPPMLAMVFRYQHWRNLCGQVNNCKVFV